VVLAPVFRNGTEVALIIAPSLGISSQTWGRLSWRPPSFPRADAVLLHGYSRLCSATIAARTAADGDVTGGWCSTAKNRRLSVVSSIGEDQA
jgi:hypothetical protein